MIRSIDWRCPCGKEVLNAMAGEQDKRTCPECGLDMEQVWWKRPCGPAQWDDNTAVLVFQNADGQIRYPGRHDARLPSGYERVYLRSLREVDAFERQHNVVNHVMHYDSNGRAIDDYIGREKVTH